MKKLLVILSISLFACKQKQAVVSKEDVQLGESQKVKQDYLKTWK